MLTGIHVKNMALIQDVEIEPRDGLNVLTGETGAGKSILIGSVNVALGTENFRDYSTGQDQDALVELTFETDNRQSLKRLKEAGIDCEDGVIIVSRKLHAGRTVNRINGETVPLKVIKEVTGPLIDIHGQHEHQSLLYPSFHLKLLDAYCGGILDDNKAAYTAVFKEHNRILKELDANSLDEAQIAKQTDLLKYEIDEIEDAALKEGEDEELETVFQKMEHGQKIMEALAQAQQLTSSENAGDMIGRSVRELGTVSSYDEQLKNLEEQIGEIDGLLSDFQRELSAYIDDFSYDEQEYYEIGRRLDLINHLKSKYGGSIRAVLSYQAERCSELEKLQDHDRYMDNLRAQEELTLKRVLEEGEKISAIRKREAKKLENKITEALRDLNFIDVKFTIEFSRAEKPVENGLDEACLLISMNPGMPMKPLQDTASGGELSRIMLAIKSVMADQDEIGTLIFDEIDTGISGRTAQKVSEKMAVIAEEHQVICITHLAQIASMSDCHFEISKKTSEGRTATSIRRLNEEESIQELARIMGGVEITSGILESASEMKAMADRKKERIKSNRRNQE